MTLLTEEEAKKRWCPFARAPSTVFNEPIAAINRGNTAQNVNCIASECMAWRVYAVEDEEHLIRDDAMTPEDDKPEGDGWRLATRYSEGGGVAYPVWRREKPRRGYCGLAGRPE